MSPMSANEDGDQEITIAGRIIHSLAEVFFEGVRQARSTREIQATDEVRQDNSYCAQQPFE